jgi:hypothetical protein
MSAGPVVVDLSALLPAQQNHDVLVRVLDQVVTTANQAQHVESVQMVDNTNPNPVLTSQVIPTGSSVKVIAGSGNDHISVDVSALPASAPQTQIDVVSGAGNDTLSIIGPTTMPVFAVNINY